MANKETVKDFINKAGIDIILQSIIEMIDSNIDASDYDIDSIKNPDDIWKFKVIENLENAYEAFLQKNKDETIGESV